MYEIPLTTEDITDYSELYKAIANLPEYYRDVVTDYIFGYTPAELAEIYDLSATSINYLIWHIIVPELRRRMTE